MLRANLSGAILLQANLESARLREADLSDANLRGATLQQANLIQAKYNSKTLFPEGFDPVQATATILPNYPIPTNPNNPEGWNYFWKYLISSGQDDEFLVDWAEDSISLITLMRRLNYQTILCAGNGISLEPYVLAYAGFAVTSLDISSYATQYISSYPMSSEKLKLFSYFSQCPQDELLSSDALNRLRTVKFVTGGIFDTVICPGLFDAIVTRRTVQLFSMISDNKMLEAMQLLLARLSPTGLLIVHGHNAYQINDFLQDWLLSQGIYASTSLEEKLEKRNQKFVWLRGTSG